MSSSHRRPNAFAGLVDDDDDDDDDENKHQAQDNEKDDNDAPSATASKGNQDNEDGEETTTAAAWEVVGGGERGQPQPCFICSEGFAKGKRRGVRLPCSASAHEDLVHRRCLNKWLRSATTCPLCRAPLPVPPPLPSSTSSTPGGGKVADEDDAGYDDELGIGAITMRELDANNNRRIASRRMGKANTFKAAKQREYAQAKRNEQRSAAAAAMATSDEDEACPASCHEQ